MTAHSAETPASTGSLSPSGVDASERRDSAGSAAFVARHSALHACLQLVRLPNLFTAVADSLAGFLYMGGSYVQLWTCSMLAIASVCLYAGGVALNDVCDVRQDRAERPHRPIPSGSVGMVGAVLLVVMLLGTGLGAAWLISQAATETAVALVATIVLYNALLKRTLAGPALMGACRGLNLLLGCVAANAGGHSSEVSLTAHLGVAAAGPVVLLFVYVCALTFFARHEAGRSDRRTLAISSWTMVAAFALIGSLPALRTGAYDTYWTLPLLPAALVALVTRPARRTTDPRDVQRAVTAAIFGIVIFDVFVVASVRGWPAAAPIAALLVPALLAGRLFRAT